MSALPMPRDSQGRPVSLAKELYRGEHQALFQVTRRPDVLAKVWLDPLDQRMQKKILAMVAVRRSALDDFYAWPTMTLHTGSGSPQHSAGEVSGFLMPQINIKEFRPLEELYLPQASQGPVRNNWPLTWSFRIQVASQIAQAFATFHAAGQVIGHISERHILVSSFGQVKFTGTDSFQVTTAEETFAARTSLLHLTPPELQTGGLATQQQTPDHDNFGLAVLVFQLLFGGRHPYSGVPVGRRMPSPGEAIASNAYAYAQQPKTYVKAPPGVCGPEVLPLAARQLFEQAFSPALTQRPTGREWQAALVAMLDALAPCEHQASHERVEGLPCPQCSQSPKTANALENPGSPPPPLPADATAPVSSTVQRLWQQVQNTAAPDKVVGLPDIPDPERLPPLPLNLPPRPSSLVQPNMQENLLRWVIRLTVLAGLMTLVSILQHSVLAAVLEVGLVTFVLTIGRRFSVDWDGLIDQFQNAEGRLVERLTPTRGQWQTYHTATEKKRTELRQRFEELRRDYNELAERYTKENVYAQYQRELLELDQQRRELLQRRQQNGAVQQLTDQAASVALSEYLKRQSVAPNAVAHLSSGMALHLSTLDVRRASDIQSAKLKLVRPELADELMHWRTRLVQFFHFNPDSIPSHQIETARQEEQVQHSAALKRFDQEVRRFVETDWQNKENTIIGQMQALKAQAKQYQNALKELDEQENK